jgi:aminopeptidase N
MKKSVTRLYETLKPTNYRLSINLDPDAMTFNGTVSLRARRTGRPSKRLTLHQKGLIISSAKVTRHDKKGDQAVDIDRINTHKSFDEIRLHSAGLLYPGEYTIELAFSGRITKAMNGLYPCFFDEGGKQKKLLATQFESHHAREVFPCIDEPEAKATFDLTLETPAQFGIVLANTPLKESKKSKGTLQSTFETTPLMSTYLLAFVAGELGYKESRTKSGTTVRVYATPDNVKHLDFAVDTAVKCLEFYEDYFDLPYPLPKSDMVALPDFASAAMENWGLITYREHALLVDKKNTSSHTKQLVAMVVAHELAHMWFGNLVTMRWWTDLWLNEGFASWIEYMAVDHIFPDWGMWTQYIADEQAVGLKLDALEHTHPVEVPIRHPDEIRTIFDAISYQKGSSVIHMLNDYLGAETFRDGLRLYLRRHQYGNTDTVDLWAALEEASKKPVRKFMHAWTSQSGYPIVKADVAEETMRLTQQRFMLNPDNSYKHGLTWPVPLLASAATEPDSFGSAGADVRFTPVNLPVLINDGHRGFYRTVYDSDHLRALAAVLPKLTPENRLGLLGDAFEAAKADHLPTTEVLELLRGYGDEQHASVWDIISGNVSELRRVMDDDQVRDNLKPFIRKLAGKQLQRLGWEEKLTESYFDRLMRPTILGLTASADEESVLDEIEKRFTAMKRSEDLRPDIRGVIYATTARLGGKKEYDKLLKLHDESKSAEERITLAAALTNFRQPELIKKSLGFITTDRVRLQDVAYWLSYSLSNRFAKHFAWQWIKDNWAWMEEHLGNDLSFYRTPVYVARSFSDPDFKSEFDAFFLPKNGPALERSIKQGREILDWHSAWKQRDLASVRKFLKP